MPSPQKPIALPRSLGGKLSIRMACDKGWSPPPVAPWITRKTIRNGRFGAKPQKKDAIVNPNTEPSSRRLRPNWFASHPVIGRMIAFATRYEVNVHVASSVVDESDPEMCGNDTLTTVVSSTSMNVADMTATAMSHGFTCQ